MVGYYLSLLADHEHVRAFRDSISATVSENDVVVDLGCGVGTYAIFAAQAGARRVFGVDAAPAIRHAHEMALRNHVQVDFIAGHSSDVELPEKATVLIFEDFSTDLLSGPTREVLESVRTRWLADDCRVLPQRVALHACLIESESVRKTVNPFPRDAGGVFGLDCSKLLEASRNTPLYVGGLEDAVLLGPPEVLLEQATCVQLPRSLEHGGQVEFSRAHVMDGLCIWNELILSETERYSNRPPGPATWGQLVLPTPDPWAVEARDCLHYSIGFDALFDQGLWKWSFRLVDPSGKTKRTCSGDSFAGSPVCFGDGRGVARDSPVQLTEQAELEARVLALADGRRTVADIARALQEQLQLHDPASAIEKVQRSLENRRMQR